MIQITIPRYRSTAFGHPPGIPRNLAVLFSLIVVSLTIATPSGRWTADAAGPPPPVLPGASRLETADDLSAAMVAGIDRMALRLIERSVSTRQPTREKVIAALGMVDERLPCERFEFVGDSDTPSLLFENDRSRVDRIRWPVFGDRDGFAEVHGEGIWIRPKHSQPIARILYIPDADITPESLVDSRLLASGCEIVIPALIDRGTAFSKTDALGIRTNLSHREWIHRQSFLLGRHLIGYELQKCLAIVDRFESLPGQTPLIVAGVGEGGMLSLYAAAIDPRIDGVYSAGYFAPRENVWQEPLERNVFGSLRDFGDAELVTLIAPRPVVLHHDGYPRYSVPRVAAQNERSIAAPGRLAAPDRQAFDREVARARKLAPESRILAVTEGAVGEAVAKQLLPEAVADVLLRSIRDDNAAIRLITDQRRTQRQVKELERFTQRLVVECEAERDAEFWKPLPLKSLADYRAYVAKQRKRLWDEVIGRLPDPDRPIHAKSRLVRTTEKVAIYEVTLDVWEDVFTWGWLCVPRDREPGKRLPVVVCQHGLEGLPSDTVNDDPKSVEWGYYKGFALRLAEEGMVTFAPHHPYRGQDAFRTLQRKLNPLGLSLFSVIIGQHQRILEWLQEQPFVDGQRIAFYGLSYGGKSAMRIPAVLTGYSMSICSGDFNEWVKYCVSTSLPIPSYVHTGEYEIWEWGLARRFNYAELAALIAPRPFMVERGHDDGCGTDEMVNYEYAKVRRLYDKLGIGDRTTIEHFDGPHTINAVGTFRFLEKFLAKSSLGDQP
jgi:hypothetical protein